MAAVGGVNLAGVSDGRVGAGAGFGGAPAVALAAWKVRTAADTARASLKCMTDIPWAFRAGRHGPQGDTHGQECNPAPGGHDVRHPRLLPGEAGGRYFPNRPASQKAAPAASPPTTRVCTADRITGAPDSRPFTPPNSRSATAVPPMEIGRASATVAKSM